MDLSKKYLYTYPRDFISPLIQFLSFHSFLFHYAFIQKLSALVRVPPLMADFNKKVTFNSFI